MSTNSFKRFTVKARQSFSGLRPFLEGHDAANEMRASPFSDNKENTPDLEDFGYTKMYTSSATSDINGSPSSKDSPSRRKRLLGTLRSMSSLRSLRSPSSKDKEKPKPRVEYELEPESPCTPTRVTQIRPSLTLNFKESPPDKPMFDLSRRRRSVSSSMVVHHSSPVPIPSPALREFQLRTMSTQPSELPAGTVPKSPTPIQKILDNDPNKAAAVPTYPSPPKMREIIEPLPTPMPGTNVGFSENDLAGDASSSKQNVMSFREGSSYFEFPVCDASNDAEDTELRHDAQCLAKIATMQESSTTNSMTDGKIMVFAALDEVEKMQRRRTLEKRDRVLEADSHNHCVQHLLAPESLADNSAYAEDIRPRTDPDECSSPIDIEHIVFEECPELTDADGREIDASVRSQAAAQPVLQRLAQLQESSESQERAAGDKPASNAWGTHGSLYDGTGYGGSSSSDSPRPSTSHTALKEGRNFSGSTMYRADSLAENSVAMARDHETLEEVIRAYAAFEDEAGISEDMIGHVVADAQADFELAESMAEYSLGA